MTQSTDYTDKTDPKTTPQEPDVSELFTTDPSLQIDDEDRGCMARDAAEKRRPAEDNRHYSDAQVCVILEWAADGLTSDDIARRLDRTPVGIHCLLSRLLSGKRPCPFVAIEALESYRVRLDDEAKKAEKAEKKRKAESTDYTERAKRPERRCPGKGGEGSAAAARLRDSFARLNVAIDVYRGVIDPDDLAEAGALKHEDLIAVLRIANSLQRAREKREARNESTNSTNDTKDTNEKPPLVRTGPGGEFARDYTPGEKLDVQA